MPDGSARQTVTHSWRQRYVLARVKACRKPSGSVYLYMPRIIGRESLVNTRQSIQPLAFHAGAQGFLPACLNSSGESEAEEPGLDARLQRLNRPASHGGVAGLSRRAVVSAPHPAIAPVALLSPGLASLLTTRFCPCLFASSWRCVCMPPATPKTPIRRARSPRSTALARRLREFGARHSSQHLDGARRAVPLPA